jgi:molybdopterin-biosynthesis enzyme MoeA-like protein
MSVALTLKDEEVNAPLSTIQVCAGMRLDGMSESEMVQQLKNFQEKIDKLKALKVSSKKIKASISTLQEQLEALVAAYDAI